MPVKYFYRSISEYRNTAAKDISILLLLRLLLLLLFLAFLNPFLKIILKIYFGNSVLKCYHHMHVCVYDSIGNYLRSHLLRAS